MRQHTREQDQNQLGEPPGIDDTPFFLGVIDSSSGSAFGFLALCLVVTGHIRSPRGVRRETAHDVFQKWR